MKKRIAAIICVALLVVTATQTTFAADTYHWGHGWPVFPGHKHHYTADVTAPTCEEEGFTTYTCACGDTYKGDEVGVVPHIDTDLDITCDFDGCTKRILPPADTKISYFTANHMIIVSLSSNYYLEGVVTEIKDNKNGK